MRIHLLKWGTLGIILLGVVLFTAGVSPYTAKAAPLREVPPPGGTCELTWKDGGGGKYTLDTSRVTDEGVKQTLQNYGLLCNSVEVKVPGCVLIPNSEAVSTSDTLLYLTNIQNSSPWIYNNLKGKYDSLVCDPALSS